MRTLPIVIVTLMLGGCTAAMVGGYQVDKQEREAAAVASDTAITTRIKSKYVADSVVSVFDIGVRTYEGTVTLTGIVGSIRARNQAEALARDTSGVRAVNNLIVLEDRSVAE